MNNSQEDVKTEKYFGVSSKKEPHTPDANMWRQNQWPNTSRTTRKYRKKIQGPCLFSFFLHDICPVGWGCRIHWLLLCRGVRPPPNECPGYDTKQSTGEASLMLELWGMRSTPSLPSLPGPLWPGVVAPDKGPIYGLNRTKPCFFHYTDFCI